MMIRFRRVSRHGSSSRITSGIDHTFISALPAVPSVLTCLTIRASNGSKAKCSLDFAFALQSLARPEKKAWFWNEPSLHPKAALATLVTHGNTSSASLQLHRRVDRYIEPYQYQKE